MKKLLELKQLDTEVRELLHCNVELPTELNICVHLHYTIPKISIYTSYKTGDNILSYEMEKDGVVFIVDDTIGIEIAKDIIEKVNEVLK